MTIYGKGSARWNSRKRCPKMKENSYNMSPAGVGIHTVIHISEISECDLIASSLAVETSIFLGELSKPSPGYCHTL